MVNALPAMSMYPVSSRSRDSGTCFAEMNRMATAIGALIRKIKPPRDRSDQESADEWSQRSGDAAESGPCADDATALFLGERRLENGEASRA